MFVTFAVLKLLKSNSVTISKLLNIHDIFSTFDVSKFERSNEESSYKSVNIQLISVTFDVTKVSGKVKLCKE